MPSTSLFLDIPDSIESNAHNLALDGGGSDSATGKISPIFSTRGRDFFQSFLFYCGLIKMAWRVVIVAEIFLGHPLSQKATMLVCL